MNLPRDGTNELPKTGFDWIALKVTVQGRKGLNLPLFSNIDTYCPFIQNLISNFSSILAWSFPRLVATNCEEKDFIESFWRSLSRSERSCLAHFHTFLYISVWSGGTFLKQCHPMLGNLWWRNTCHVGTLYLWYWGVPWRKVLLYCIWSSRTATAVVLPGEYICSLHSPDVSSVPVTHCPVQWSIFAHSLTRWQHCSS